MAFKHYDLVSASSGDELQKKLTEKINEGWQPYGSPLVSYDDYGAYKNLSAQNIFFVPFLTDENGANTPTNAPAEDPDIVAVGYYGAASRTQANWTTAQRDSHFSSWARRGVIADRLASAILLHAGRTAALMGGQVVTQPDEKPSPDVPSTPSTDTPSTPPADTTTMTTLFAYRASESGGAYAPQGWSAGGGKAEIVDDAG
ncbi:DUF1737 domain-containing protein, partial [Escherichia coli]